MTTPLKQEDANQTPAQEKNYIDEEGIERLPNGLPKNYNTMVRPGVPDGNDPNNPVRVYADGVFDMYHIGHARVLEQAKKLFKHSYLIVGVSGDKETIEKKGKIVMNEVERTDILKHCKWVDEVICPCPWIVTADFLKKNKIHYVAHDDLPYVSAGQEDIYYEVKMLGMFRATQRTDGISTSDIILRIIKDYDLYVERSLKRGYKREDIGISKTKELRVKFKQNLREIKDQVKQQFKPKTADGDSDGQLVLKKQPSGVQSIMRVFQKLEYSTEQLWLDFSKQYSTIGSSVFAGSRQAIQDLKDKYLDDAEQAQALEEELERKNRIQKQISDEEQNGEKEEDKPKSIWQRAWKCMMENLDFDSYQQEASEDPFTRPDDEDDEDAASDAPSGQEGEDGLNKRQRKFLRKQNGYSDVL